MRVKRGWQGVSWRSLPKALAHGSAFHHLEGSDDGISRLSLRRLEFFLVPLHRRLDHFVRTRLQPIGQPK